MTWPPRQPPMEPPWRPPLPGRAFPPIPMVPIRSEADDPNVFSRLLDRRVVLLAGTLTQDAASLATAQLMLLDAKGDDPVDLHLSCPDGDLDAAIAVADTIELMGVTVRVRCGGKVGGAALALLAAADRRFASPHCVFVLRDPTVRMEGRADDVALQAGAHQRQLDGLHDRLAAATGQPSERVVADMRRGLTLNAEEAVAYGLVDEVAATAR